MPKTGNINNLFNSTILQQNPVTAELLLRHRFPYVKEPLPPGVIQVLIEATDYVYPAYPDDERVPSCALGFIEHLRDKRPFIDILKRHASNISNPKRAAAAYKAMGGAQDFTPFYQVLKEGIKSSNSDIAWGALHAVHREAEKRKSVPDELRQIVIESLHHPDDKIPSFVIDITKAINDKKPFLTALRERADDHTRPKVASKAAEFLRSLIFVVRLDFNIKDNGVGPDMNKQEAAEALGKAFGRSAICGVIKSKAKVFSAPTGLGKDATIDVIFPKPDEGDILKLSFQGFAPEFVLEAERNGAYRAILQDRPSL